MSQGDEILPPLEAAYPADGWELLSPMLTPTRRQRIHSVLQRRTRQVRLVIQDVHQPHNVSACLRSAEAFGVQDVDVVTLKQKFSPSSVAKGVAPWLTLRRYHSVESSIEALRKAGYRVAAGLPRPDAVPLTEIKPDQKIAVVFGNEHSGLDSAWLKEVDLAFTIPMTGMVESLNISVSAAITLFHLTETFRRLLPPEKYLLSDVERQQILNAWACRQTGQFQHVLASLRAQSPKGTPP